MEWPITSSVHGEDVVQTVVDVQGISLRSGGLIAIMDSGTEGQMLQDGLLHAWRSAFGDLAQPLQVLQKGILGLPTAVPPNESRQSVRGPVLARGDSTACYSLLTHTTENQA